MRGPIPMIAGLYPYTRGSVTRPPVVTLREIPECLQVNPWYRDELVVLAGDRASAEHLEGFGLTVRRVFTDAPAEIHRDAAHKMKHWMCRWALDAFGAFLWVDWDTVCVRRPDEAFAAWARAHGTPKFIGIPGYWAKVNCGVYSASAGWAAAMDESFGTEVAEPNDELLWASVLPGDVRERREFWWGDRVVHVEREEEIDGVGRSTYFAHVKRLDWAAALRARALGAR